MSVTEQTRPATTAKPRHAQMLIGGNWVDAVSGATLTVENPGRRSPIAHRWRSGIVWCTAVRGSSSRR